MLSQQVVDSIKLVEGLQIESLTRKLIMRIFLHSNDYFIQKLVPSAQNPTLIVHDAVL